MTLSLEEQMRIAAGYSEQEGGEEPKKHEVVQPTPVQQNTVTTEYVKPESILIIFSIIVGTSLLGSAFTN